MNKNKKDIMYSFIACVLIAGIFLLPILLIYSEVKNIFVSQLKAKAISIGETVSVLIDQDMQSYRKLYENEDYASGSFDREYYERMLKSFRTIREKTNASYVFTEKILSKDQIQFILDGSEPDSEDFSNIGDIDEGSEFVYNAYINKESVATDIVYTEGWGSYITGFVPIIDNSSGDVLGFACVDFSADQVVSQLNILKIILAIAFVLLSSLSIFVYFYSQNYVYKRVNIDLLTEVNNRRCLDDNLKQIIKAKEKFIVAFLDVDNFKFINDKYGHLKGDLILKRVANLITINLKKEDRVYRYGGDEFFIIFSNTNINGAEIACNRLLKQAEVIKAENRNEDDAFVTLSIGIAEYVEGMSAQEIIHLADVALKNSKESGKNQLSVYNGEDN